MNIKGEIIAYHGWGFDKNCWNNWQEILSNNYTFKVFDRGYFGDEILQRFDNNQSNKIIFAHSYGLHLCPQEQLKTTDLLILFSSFDYFHPYPEKQKKRSKYALELMINEFTKNPQKVLEAFQKKCYYPLSYIPNNHSIIHWDKLSQDLVSLDSSQINREILKNVPEIYIIQGTKDRILSPFHAQKFAKKLTKNSQYYEIEGVGHTLPFTDMKYCLPIINQALGETENHGNT
ncbi:alpha/beta hydrolase [Crocosphaera sp. XPORK-15E]|uniref:alpha/beta hydrolase n=1 Tax=Crocosphaera sp. XPORK-15E TaxID=3110247 RepID=UPI002B2186C4|nr:alpha/beta hydrolase [Crocosphaera sp. XPORK-15E]MEA5533968.1 alpha/beta hydrolase [Crocosphaera sp. XPORK-15E]